MEPLCCAVLLLGDHEYKAEKLPLLCTTSCPTSMLKGVHEGEGKDDRAHEGDCERDGP